MNIGDMLHRWRNRLLISTPHRVINCTWQKRYSYPFLLEPNVNVKVSQLPCCITHERTKQFDSVIYYEFLGSELQSRYDRHEVSNWHSIKSYLIFCKGPVLPKKHEKAFYSSNILFVDLQLD